jgi:hypothetical protein
MPTPPRSSQQSLDQAVKDFLGAQPHGPTAPAGAPAQRPAPRSVAAARPSAPALESDQLRAAYDGVLKHEAEKAAALPEGPPALWRRLLLPILLLALTAASAYIWFGNPAWLAPPPHVALTRPATPLTGERQLVAVALQVDDFRRTTGRLPRDLAELGLNAPHIAFTALPELRYELRLGTGPHSLFYQGGPDSEPRIQTGVTP